MRVHNSMHIGRLGLGQAITQPEFIKFALANSYQVGIADELRTIWNKMAVSTVGDTLVRMGRIVTNDTRYKYFPDDRYYMPVLYFYGGKAGAVEFLPVEEFMSRFRIVNDAAQLPLLVQAPVPPDFASPITLATLVAAVSDGYDLAQQALTEANRGNVSMARIRLDGGGGASSKYEQSNLEMKVLIGFGLMSQEEAFDFGKQIQGPLADMIGRARGAIERQKSEILAVYDYSVDLIKRVAVQLSDLAKDKWENLVKVYVTAYTYLAKQRKVVNDLAATATTPEQKNAVVALQKSLMKFEFVVSTIESQMKAVGVDVTAIRTSHGLGAGPAAAPIVIAAAAAGTATVMSTIKHTILAGIIFSIVGHIYEAIVHFISSFWADRKLVEEFKKSIRAKEIAEEEVRQEDIASGKKSNADKSFERMQKSFEGVKNVGDLGSSLEAISTDDALKAKVASAQDAEKEMRNAMNSLGGWVSYNLNTILLVSGALFGAYLLLRPKE